MLFIFSTPVLIKHLWKLKTVVLQHRCLKMRSSIVISQRHTFQAQKGRPFYQKRDCVQQLLNHLFVTKVRVAEVRRATKILPSIFSFPEGIRSRRTGRQTGQVFRLLPVCRHLPAEHHGLHRTNRTREALRDCGLLSGLQQVSSLSH